MAKIVQNAKAYVAKSYSSSPRPQASGSPPWPAGVAHVAFHSASSRAGKGAHTRLQEPCTPPVPCCCFPLSLQDELPRFCF